MKPDGMLVEPAHIVSACQDIVNKGAAHALEEFGGTEPALASFIRDSLAGVAGKLSLSGAPTEVVQGSHQEVLTTVLTCVQALRRGHFELWKDTMTGTRLAQLDEGFRPARTRRRKKGRSPDAQGETGEEQS
jgi:hypothetical protein